MPEALNADTIGEIAKRLNEPGWLTELRRKAWAAHTGLPWPHASDDIWRRTDASLLDPLRGFSLAQPALLQSIRLTETQLAGLTRPLGQEQLVVRVDGVWLTEAPSRGIVIQELPAAAQSHPDPIRQAIEADGLTEAEQKLASLNLAFHHDDLFVQVPANFSGEQPLRLVRLLTASARRAAFPMTIIAVGAGSSVTLIDEYVSVTDPSAAPAPHLVNSPIELVLEPDASVHYVRLQR